MRATIGGSKMDRLLKTMRQELKSIKENTTEVIDLYIKEVSQLFLTHTLSPLALEELEGLCDDLKYETEIELNKLL